MHIFPKMNVSTRLHKNGHNSTHDQYFFTKLAPLDSAHIELSIHAKNSVFMKNCKWSIFPWQVTFYISAYSCVSHAIAGRHQAALTSKC